MSEEVVLGHQFIGDDIRLFLSLYAINVRFYPFPVSIQNSAESNLPWAPLFTFYPPFFFSLPNSGKSLIPLFFPLLSFLRLSLEPNTKHNVNLVVEFFSYFCLYLKLLALLVFFIEARFAYNFYIILPPHKK